jgi:hypothetical protein
MKTKVYVGPFMLLAIASCYSCSLKAQDNAGNTTKPGVHITVHKQTDKNGNVISYDSEYSYTYQGNPADTNLTFNNFMIGTDSMPVFSHLMPNGMNNPFFRNFNMNMDMGDIQKTMEEQMKQMQEMMQSMQQGMNMQGVQPIGPVVPKQSTPQKCLRQHGNPPKNNQQKNNVSPEGVNI